MSEDHNRDFVTQEETGEAAPVDQVEGRAREAVGQGLQDEEVERAGRELREEGEREVAERRQE